MSAAGPETPPPTFWRLARRPKWIAVLLLALAIAAAFALLGRWQLERSFADARSNGPDTEAAVPLAGVAAPQQPVDQQSAWRKVTVSLRIVAGDTELLSGRRDDGVAGWWVVGHAVDATGASLAVAAGWAPTEAAASQAAAAFDRAGDLGTVEGRYLPTESPQQSDFEHGVRSALATAELVNLWAEPGPTYGGYLVLAAAPAGLTTIDAPPPSAGNELNLLNLFYALEWVIFAGGALYLWWRLVQDELERLRDQGE